METYSAASGLSLHFKSSCGIWRQKAQYASSVAYRAKSEIESQQVVGFDATYVADPRKLIRGSKSYVVHTEAIPSLFSITEQGVAETGYIVQLKGVTAGSAVDEFTYHYDTGVHVDVVIPVVKFVYVTAVRHSQNLMQLICAALGALSGLLVVGTIALHFIEHCILLKMALKRHIRRRRGVGARYVPKMRAAFVALMEGDYPGKDECEAASYFWSKLGKDHYWRISDRHLMQQLHAVCNSVTIDDVREAVSDFDTDNDRLLDYGEFVHILRQLRVVPERTLNNQQAEDFWTNLKSNDSLSKRQKILENDVIELKDTELAEQTVVVETRDEFAANLSKNAEIRDTFIELESDQSIKLKAAEEVHDWLSDLMKTAGVTALGGHVQNNHSSPVLLAANGSTNVEEHSA